MLWPFRAPHSALSRCTRVQVFPRRGSGTFAREPRGRLLIAPKFGVFKAAPSRLPAAFFVGAEVGFVTPLLDDALAFTLELDWQRSKASGATSDPRLTVNGPPADGTYRLGEEEIGLPALGRIPRRGHLASGAHALWRRAGQASSGIARR